MKDQKCFTFATGPLINPILHPKKAKQTAEFIKTLPGFIGIHNYADKERMATFFIFDTLNNAKISRNRMRKQGIETANHIMNARIEDNGKMLAVFDVAEE